MCPPPPLPKEGSIQYKCSPLYRATQHIPVALNTSESAPSNKGKKEFKEVQTSYLSMRVILSKGKSVDSLAWLDIVPKTQKSNPVPLISILSLFFGNVSQVNSTLGRDSITPSSWCSNKTKPWLLKGLKFLEKDQGAGIQGERELKRPEHMPGVHEAPKEFYLLCCMVL